ncbi:MAG TPA: hypothetical protein VEC16_05005, partial [Alphaproteobacteria bacterium]|nr:hypothetical protein [Alphaproteobacteria bacterium]
VEYYRNIGEQIESILAPSEEIEKTLGIRAEAPLLVKYTKADNTVKNNLTAIRNYLDTRGLSKSFIPEKLDIRFVPQNVRFLNEMSTPDKLVVQYIMAAYPGTQLEKAADVMYNLSREQISDISEIIFKDHTKYNEMPQQIATPQELTLLLAGTLGEARDFNRHRAWGRFMPDVPLFNGPEINSYMFDAILNKGYGLCSYVTDVPEFKHLKDMICEGFDKYYSKLVDFKTEIEKEYGKDIDYTFMMNTLPLGHNSDIIMHGNIKQAHYMTHLRVRNGGLINYRQMAYDAAKLISEHDPVYKRMMPPGNRPDASNRDQFLDRS